MKKTFTYLFSFLLVVSMGGAFHLHDEEITLDAGEKAPIIAEHNCDNHEEHPEIPGDSTCRECSRISHSASSQLVFSYLFGLTLVTVCTITGHSIHIKSDIYSNSQPRSPPEHS